MNSKQVEILNAKCTCNNEDRMKKMDINKTRGTEVSYCVQY